MFLRCSQRVLAGEGWARRCGGDCSQGHFAVPNLLIEKIESCQGDLDNNIIFINFV